MPAAIRKVDPEQSHAFRCPEFGLGDQIGFPDFTEVREALRLMQQASHFGKIAIEFPRL